MSNTPRTLEEQRRLQKQNLIFETQLRYFHRIELLKYGNKSLVEKVLNKMKTEIFTKIENVKKLQPRLNNSLKNHNPITIWEEFLEYLRYLIILKQIPFYLDICKNYHKKPNGFYERYFGEIYVILDNVERSKLIQIETKYYCLQSNATIVEENGKLTVSEITTIAYNKAVYPPKVQPKEDPNQELISQMERMGERFVEYEELLQEKEKEIEELKKLHQKQLEEIEKSKNELQSQTIVEMKTLRNTDEDIKKQIRHNEASLSQTRLDLFKYKLQSQIEENEWNGIEKYPAICCYQNKSFNLRQTDCYYIDYDKLEDKTEIILPIFKLTESRDSIEIIERKYTFNKENNKTVNNTENIVYGEYKEEGCEAIEGHFNDVKIYDKRSQNNNDGVIFHSPKMQQIQQLKTIQETNQMDIEKEVQSETNSDPIEN